MTVLFRAVFFSSTVLLLAGAAFGAQKAAVIQEASHGVTPPLRSLAVTLKGAGAATAAAEPDEDEDADAGSAAVAQLDSVEQLTATTKLGTVPGMNLAGLGLNYIGPQGKFSFTWAPSGFERCRGGDAGG